MCAGRRSLNLPFEPVAGREKTPSFDGATARAIARFLGRNDASYPGGNRDAWHEADFKWDGKHDLVIATKDACGTAAYAQRLNRELALPIAPTKLLALLFSRRANDTR